MTIHDEHRERVRTRFLREGLTNFEEHEALELLLFYAIPRKNTNDIAHRLLEDFGSLRRVMEAPPEQLMQTKGIGEKAAILLHLVSGMANKYMVSELPDTSLGSVDEIGKYLIDRFIGFRDEVVMLLCLDARRVPLACRIIHRGSVNAAEISVRKVVETALALNATSVVLAHNHPSGIAVPSMEDIVTTRRMGYALNAVQITLEDHLVFADRDFVSIRQSGYYDPDECRVMV